MVDDEIEHAALGWAFVAWAIATGGEAVRAPVQGVLERATRAGEPAAPTTGGCCKGIDHRHWSGHGRLDGARFAALTARSLREDVAACRAALLAPARGRRLQA